MLLWHCCNTGTGMPTAQRPCTNWPSRRKPGTPGPCHRSTWSSCHRGRSCSWWGCTGQRIRAHWESPQRPHRTWPRGGSSRRTRRWRAGSGRHSAAAQTSGSAHTKEHRRPRKYPGSPSPSPPAAGQECPWQPPRPSPQRPLPQASWRRPALAQPQPSPPWWRRWPFWQGWQPLPAPARPDRSRRRPSSALRRSCPQRPASESSPPAPGASARPRRP
mmetsp:Transcript_9138/g.19672  ORF Transcript_9138/g.19672 Transcript_9138/m.19672 type:complete len:217 (-) Transcript_9138:296-946(-)